jgi:hypothetical protein
MSPARRVAGLAISGVVWDIPTMKTATLDDKRRLVMPPECPPRSAVTIQRIDDDTWLVKRAVEEKKFKKVFIPMIEELPQDPDWDKVEAAFGRAAYQALRPKK